MLSISHNSSFNYIYKKLFPQELACNANNWSIKPYFLSQFYNLNLNKYSHLNNMLKISFYSKKCKDDFFNNFCTTQKVYMGFLKLYSIFKWKKAKLYNIDSDLYGIPLSKNKKYIIKILENNTIYSFKIHDLLNIIKDNLSNIFIPEYLVFFQEPKMIKNPYTNLIFKKSVLYNIYFFYKQIPYFKTQDLFEKFFISNFDIKLFGIHFESETREVSIVDYLKNLTIHEYFEGIKKMCKDFSGRLKKKKWVHVNFPKEIFVEAYKPFYIIYVMTKLTLSNTRYNFYNHYLLVKLKRFIKENPSFGRQYITIVNKTEFINDKFIRKRVRRTHYHTDYTPLKDISRKKIKQASNFYEVSQDQIFYNTNLQQINQTMSEVPTERNNSADDVMYDYNSDDSSDSDDDDDYVNINVSHNIIQPQSHPLYHDNEQEITIIDNNLEEITRENTYDSSFWSQQENTEVVLNNENNMNDFSYNHQYSSYYDISYSSNFNAFLFQEDGFVEIPRNNEEVDDSDKENDEGLDDDEVNNLIENLSLD